MESELAKIRWLMMLMLIKDDQNMRSPDDAALRWSPEKHLGELTIGGPTRSYNMVYRMGIVVL